MLRITLTIVPNGMESRQYPIGNIEICNLEDNGDGTSNYAVIMQKHGPFGTGYRIAEDKELVSYDERGRVVAVRDHDDDDIKVVQVRKHHRTKREAHDLLYRALIALGHAERNDRTVG